MQARLLDLDASLVSQPTLWSAVLRGEVRRVWLRDLADSLRIVASRRALRELRRRLMRDDAARPAGACVDFVGSGDFHHITAVLLRRFSEPLTVVHVDNHPDWVGWPRTFNCGGWVNRALELPHVRRVITLGPCSADLSLPETKFANLGAVASGSLEVYPWRHEPSRVLRGYGEGASHATRDGQVVWKTLADVSWSDFVTSLIARIPTRAVYLTIDKDALAPTDAVTNWDQGEMTVEHVLTLIEQLASARCLVGADVCGDYSPPAFTSTWRRLLSWFDRGTPAAPTPVACARNDATNARLLDTFARCAA
jgi:arginase family enzyme